MSAVKFYLSTSAPIFRIIFFADKADAFKNWYIEPTPKFIEGISEQDWRMTKVHFDIRQTVHRNHDKYAKPLRDF